MYRRAPFIWIAQQKINHDLTFRQFVSQEPVRREDGVNGWFLFRRRFSLPSQVEKADLSITVDGRYKLYVNGRLIGRGPVRSSPHYQRYDTYHISDELTEGENVFAVLVHVYGVDTAWYETVKGYWQPFFGDGGLYCDAKILCQGGRSVNVLTDDSWVCQECSAWDRSTPRGGWGQDFIESFDADAYPQGWTDVIFDDSGWDFAQILSTRPEPRGRAMGWGPIEPFPCLIANDLPPLAESPVAPMHVLACYAVTPSPDLPLDFRLYKEELSQLPDEQITSPGAMLSPDESVTIVTATAHHDVSLVIAFEKIHAGYPYIEIDAEGGEIIELAVNETYAGEFEDIPPEEARLARQSYLDCAHLFRYKARPGIQRFEKFEWTAIRYMQITVRNAPHGLKIRHVGSVATHYPADYRGAFTCSDEFLNRLWKIGRYTAEQCTHDAWEDCPGREKRQWFGDGIVHYLVGAAAFGPSTQAVDRKFFYDAAQSQRPDGLIQMFAPGDHYTNGVIIPDYALHWICGAYEYLLHTGDDETIAEIFPAMQRALAWFERQIGPNGLLADLPFWHFIEWAAVGREGEAAILNAMYAGTLQAAATMAGHLGYKSAAEKYLALKNQVARSLNKRHWDEDRLAYVDVVDPATGAQGQQISQHANAAMILWDIAPHERWPSMIERITDPARLKLTAVPPIVITEEPFDPETDVVRANTFFSHFVFSALAKAGRFDLALKQIRINYKPMLDTGAETLWEGFEPAASLCHVFSATPVYQLSAQALGVRPLAPGFQRFRVAIQPADLDHVKGIYPSIKGDIHVAWWREGQGITLELTVPDGTIAQIIAPCGYSHDGPPERNPGGHRILFTRERTI